MDLREFVALVPDFSRLSHPERVKHFGWYLHTQKMHERFNQGSIRECYVEAHMEPLNLTKEFRRLQNRTPRELLKDLNGYRLEHSVREALDKKYGAHATTVLVSQLLKDL